MTPNYPQSVQFKHWDCAVTRSHYNTDPEVPALFLSARIDQGPADDPIREGERIAVASVNLAQGEFPLLPGFVWIKSWAENEGMAEALERAGIIGPKVGLVPAGHVFATIHKLLEPTK